MHLSSSLKEGTTTYGVANLVYPLVREGVKNPWAVAAKDAIGSSVSIKIRNPRSDLSGVIISSGFVSTSRPDLYLRNSRPKTLKITSSNRTESETITLLDTPYLQIIHFAAPVSDATITVEAVYPGTKYSDLCVNLLLGLFQPNE